MIGLSFRTILDVSSPPPAHVICPVHSCRTTEPSCLHPHRCPARLNLGSVSSQRLKSWAIRVSERGSLLKKQRRPTTHRINTTAKHCSTLRVHHRSTLT
ncbi:hypothetical protein Mapa_000812 [Marchantia paleacea]|nr:hypothetical protein Mapa_000812 [Marchantia paleacea]